MQSLNSQNVKKPVIDLVPKVKPKSGTQPQSGCAKCLLPPLPKLNTPKKRKNVICCRKDLAPMPSKPVAPSLPPFLDAVNCELPVKPEKLKKEAAKERSCKRPASYKSADEQRAYLDSDVVPVLMEGLMALAREKPDDPITFLSKFWLQDQHECDVKLPDDIL